MSPCTLIGQTLQNAHPTKHTSYYAHGENQSEVEDFRMKTSALCCHRTEQYARQQQDKFLFELVTK